VNVERVVIWQPNAADIGEIEKEIEFEPLPEEVPAEPVPEEVPA
jgi:hypothetical protein